MLERKRRFSPWGRAFAVALFPVVLVYYEIVFKLSTVGGFWSAGTFFTVLFSVAFGLIGYLISTAFKNKKANYIASLVVLALTALIFLIEYFIFRKFKIFYNLGSMFSNGADAVGGFSLSIFRMVFSWDGFFKIALFLLPTILYAIFGRDFSVYQKSWWLIRVVAVVAAVLLYAVSVLLSMLNPYLKGIQTVQYEFNSAANNLGLMSAFRLDIQDMLFEKDDTFEPVVTMPVIPQDTKPIDPTDGATDETSPTETVPPETEPPVVYTPNVMDLNFSGTSDKKIQELNTYVSGCTPSMKNAYTGMFKGKNLILITAEAFTAEVVDPVLTPTLYRLANSGIRFTQYYQTAAAGTTGGEYMNIFGMLPTMDGESFKKTAENLNYFTMGSQLDRLGYYGQAFHNNTYTYYDRHKTHINLGYSAGYMGYGNGMEKYVVKHWPQSDLEMIQGTLPLYMNKQPFNAYYMTVSGHSDYTQGDNHMVDKNWDRVAHLPYSDMVKGYLAAQLGLEDALAYLVEQLELAGIADDTVICLTTDHDPYGLDKEYQEELFGFPIKNKFDKDHSCLIMWCGELEDQEPIVVDTPTSVLDILPTLSNLFGTEFDSRLMPGRDVFSDAPVLVFNSGYDWKTEYGTYISSTGEFYPVSEDVEIPDEYVATVKKIVRNKVRYCQLVLETDYFRSLFPNG